MRAQKGFTLIELLVVIAIIAILAAILFPVFTEARTSAYTSQCASNMHQMGLAVQAYRDTNNGNLPQAGNIWTISYDAGKQKWSDDNYFQALYPYLKNKGVMACRSKPIAGVKESLAGLWYYDPEPGKRQNPTPWHGVVYTTCLHKNWAGRITSGSMAEMVWSRGKTVVNPDTVSYGSDYKCNGPAQAVLLFCMSGTWTISWDDPWIHATFPDGIAHGTHKSGTPSLFADGHVKFVDYRKVGNL